MKGWHMFLRTILFPIGKLVFPCRVMNKDKYEKYDRGQIILYNHLSWMDVVYMYFGVKGYKRMLSKKENSGNKLQMAFLHSIGVIFVDRDKPELSAMRTCINALKDGETLGIAPEGTRNRINRDLQPLHSGAALFALKGNARVIPIVIQRKGRLFRMNYIGVGDAVDLSDLYGKRTDEHTLQEATDRFRAAMQKTLDELDVWVEQKGYKRERKRKKLDKKLVGELDGQYKTARKSFNKSCSEKP